MNSRHNFLAGIKNFQNQGEKKQKLSYASLPGVDLKKIVIGLD
jgi:hypothetical protein